MARKKRVARVVYGAFVIVVAAFVISNIAQVASALFGSGAAEAASAGGAATVGPACAEELRGAIARVELARAAASTEPNGDAAKARYERERQPPPAADPERACAGEARGHEALAALARLDRAARTRALRDAEQLKTVRRGAQSFISGHTR